MHALYKGLVPATLSVVLNHQYFQLPFEFSDFSSQSELTTEKNAKTQFSVVYEITVKYPISLVQ